MRTLVDAICPGCGDVHSDVWIDTGRPESLPWCAHCKVRLVRHRCPPAAHSDSYRGGVWIEHGLCHADGSPRRFDSQRAIDREAKRRGLVNIVEHKDDSRETQRFV